jgi:hypothetical protein
MTRRILWLAMLALVAGTAGGMSTQSYSSGATALLITQVNLNTEFTDNHSGGESVPFRARHVLIRSLGTSANICHFDLGADGVATTADHPLEPGASIPINWDETTGGTGGGWARIGAICAAGQTASWRVDAWR